MSPECPLNDSHMLRVRLKLTVFIYYMEGSVLLGTKPLVDSIRHFIRDPSGVFSVCHLCDCRIVQWRHDSHLLPLLNWFALTREILFLPLEHKIHIFLPPFNILYKCDIISKISISAPLPSRSRRRLCYGHVLCWSGLVICPYSHVLSRSWTLLFWCHRQWWVILQLLISILRWLV